MRGMPLAGRAPHCILVGFSATIGLAGHVETRSVDSGELPRAPSGDLDTLPYAIFPDVERVGCLMAIFTAPFDTSGHPADQPFVVVSGYVANYAQWQAFGTMWNNLHKRFTVPPPFHMADFMARRKPYDKWRRDDPEADDFLANLATVQQLYVVFGISCTVKMSDYHEINSVLDLRKVVPPFAMAARTCVAALKQWERRFHIKQPVECIFEDGDFERGKFIDLMRVEDMPTPIFKDKKDFPGLQAADHAAWEQNFYLKQELIGRHKPCRFTFEQLRCIPHIHLQVTKESILNVCEVKGIDPRSRIIRP